MLGPSQKKLNDRNNLYLCNTETQIIMTKKTKKPNKQKDAKSIEKDVFKVIEKAQKQYQDYIDIAQLSEYSEEKPKDLYLKRDMNHPLTIVLK